jgi:hypothetical protein
MFTAELLTYYETCERKGVWSRDWTFGRLGPTALLHQAISDALLDRENEDHGRYAGERLMELVHDFGIETRNHSPYEVATHHACLADILTTHLRKGTESPWERPPVVEIASGVTWETSAFLEPSGEKLRRVILVDHWGEDRNYSELHSWYTLGEMAVYRMPMTEVVLALGASRDGKRHSPWTKGLLHPRNKKLRFRRIKRTKFEGFTETWIPIWREDYDQIARETWLAGMEEDDVLQDLCFLVDVPMQPKSVLDKFREMACRKLEQLYKRERLPGGSLSVCDDVRQGPCPFQKCCYSVPEGLPENTGFIRRGTPED